MDASDCLLLEGIKGLLREVLEVAVGEWGREARVGICVNRNGDDAEQEVTKAKVDDSVVLWIGLVRSDRATRPVVQET